MPDTPKNPQQNGRSAPPKKDRRPAAPAVSAPSRRSAKRSEREHQRQRIVIIATATAIGLALLAVLIGLGYDQLWLPSRPVAQVGNTSLSRRDYWAERRLAYAREINQNFQLLALFGGNAQFAQQFAGQSPTINRAIKNIRSAAVEDAVVEQWQTFQIKAQGAANLNLSVSDDEIRQRIASDLAQIFIPPPAEPISPTATLEPTAAAEATAVAQGTPAATATEAPTAAEAPTAPATATPGGPTATAAPSSTPAPTSTLEPTPQPAEAATQVDQIVDEIFRRYEIELATSNENAILTRDDFRAALFSEYREQILNSKLQESLVPAEDFPYSQEPKRVHARQILVAVNPPAEATQEQIDAAFAEAKPQADALVESLRNGADFAELASAESDDPGSQAAGGDMGFFDKDGKADNGATYPPELVTQAFSLALNTISDPIRTQFGWHIIEVTDHEVPSEDEQLSEARTKALDTWLEEQRGALTVRRFPEPTPTPIGEPGTPTPTLAPIYQPGPPTVEPTVEPIVEPTPTATATS